MAVTALREAGRRNDVDVSAEIVEVRTTGDAVTDRPFEAIGPKGVFAAELQNALLNGEVDVAVHSLKDLPAVEPDGLVLGAVCEREDPRDVLASREGATLSALPPGAVVGTSSSRREALVRIHRPDLRTAPMRGNVDTRLQKVERGEFDAAVLAAAGVLRLGRSDAVSEWLDPFEFVPPPGQGALVVELRSDRLSGDLAWVAAADDEDVRTCVEAERAFMRDVEGGCEVPLGGWARREGTELVCEGFVAAADGSSFLRDTVRGSDPEAVGTELARRFLERGAARLRQRSG